MTRTSLILASALMLSVGAGSAFAQTSTGGSAADPNSPANRQVAPTPSKPGDPAAAGNPAAQKPTAPNAGSASTGTSAGESGTSSDPAVNPADPNAQGNAQPAPAAKKPSDTSGSKPTTSH